MAMEQLAQLYERYKWLLINILLVCSLIVAMRAKADSVRSFALGIAAGIALVALGENINRIRNRAHKKAPQV